MGALKCVVEACTCSVVNARRAGPRRHLAWERRRRKTWKGGAHPRHAESAEHGLRIVAVARGAAGGGADDTRLTTTQSPYGRGPCSKAVIARSALDLLVGFLLEVSGDTVRKAG